MLQTLLYLMMMCDGDVWWWCLMVILVYSRVSRFTHFRSFLKVNPSTCFHTSRCGWDTRSFNQCSYLACSPNYLKFCYITTFNTFSSMSNELIQSIMWTTHRRTCYSNTLRMCVCVFIYIHTHTHVIVIHSECVCVCLYIYTHTCYSNTLRMCVCLWT